MRCVRLHLSVTCCGDVVRRCSTQELCLVAITLLARQLCGSCLRSGKNETKPTGKTDFLLGGVEFHSWHTFYKIKDRLFWLLGASLDIEETTVSASQSTRPSGLAFSQARAGFLGAC